MVHLESIKTALHVPFVSARRRKISKFPCAIFCFVLNCGVLGKPNLVVQIRRFKHSALWNPRKASNSKRRSRIRKGKEKRSDGKAYRERVGSWIARRRVRVKSTKVGDFWRRTRKSSALLRVRNEKEAFKQSNKGTKESRKNKIRKGCAGQRDEWLKKLLTKKSGNWARKNLEF